MRKLFVFAVVALFVCIAANVSEAAFRCGNFFVDPGVEKEEVRYYCGEPARVSEEGFRGSGAGQILERWVYGPDAGYIYILHFRGSVLENLEEKRLR